MITIGQKASRTMQFNSEMVKTFAAISGDNNPIHLDAEYAATTPFKRCIAHGILVSSLISAVIANDLPGPGTIYLHQDLNFQLPVYVGDTITAEVEITEIHETKPIAHLSTTCYNEKNEIVIQGKAIVKFTKQK